jgi:hypothetical protein
MRWILFVAMAISIFLRPEISRAEYRAFDLIIIVDGSKSVRHVLSNLDPVQYVGYYSLNAHEKIYYEDTWMCKGRTGDFQPICPNPKANSAPVPTSPLPAS